MTQKEWDASTDEQRAEEFERCKNPVYFYNTYWICNGVKPHPITQEQWDERMQYFDNWDIKRFKRK